MKMDNKGIVRRLCRKGKDSIVCVVVVIRRLLIILAILKVWLKAVLGVNVIVKKDKMYFLKVLKRLKKLDINYLQL
jgi:hypothetical protein